MSLFIFILAAVVFFLTTPASGRPPLAQRQLEKWGFTTFEAYQMQAMAATIVLLLIVAHMAFKMLG